MITHDEQFEGRNCCSFFNICTRLTLRSHPAHNMETTILILIWDHLHCTQLDVRVTLATTCPNVWDVPMYNTRKRTCKHFHYDSILPSYVTCHDMFAAQIKLLVLNQSHERRYRIVTLNLSQSPRYSQQRLFYWFMEIDFSYVVHPNDKMVICLYVVSAKQ